MFVTSILSTPIDESYQNKQIFLRRKNIKEKSFSLNYSFSFLSSVLCLLTDNKVAQKTVHEKSFSEKLVFWKKKHFNYLYPSSVPHWYFIPKISKKISFLKVFLCSKKSPKLFFFLSSGFCTPTDNNVLQKIFSWKELFIGNFFSNIVFNYSHQPCVPPPLIFFTKPLKLRFSWN